MPLRNVYIPLPVSSATELADTVIVPVQFPVVTIVPSKPAPE